jgi:hypothetical protein
VRALDAALDRRSGITFSLEQDDAMIRAIDAA